MLCVNAYAALPTLKYVDFAEMSFSISFVYAKDLAETAEWTHPTFPPKLPDMPALEDDCWLAKLANHLACSSEQSYLGTSYASKNCKIQQQQLTPCHNQPHTPVTVLPSFTVCRTNLLCLNVIFKWLNCRFFSVSGRGKTDRGGTLNPNREASTSAISSIQRGSRKWLT